MLPPAPRPMPDPEIGHVLARCRTHLRRYLTHADLTPGDRGEILALNDQLGRAADDPAHPIRGMILLAESEGYERGKRLVAEMRGERLIAVD